MLRIGDAQIPWTPLLEVAQVMQRAMSLLVSIGRVTTPRTRVPDVVATVGDELGRRQVGGGCDPFTRVGAILSGTGHRVGLLAHRLDPDYTVHAWRGKPGILAIVSKKTGLKDNIALAGIPQTNGSRVADGYIPDCDATVAERLLDAGAEIVGKLNMDAFALSPTGETSAFGYARNPHNPDHSPGGSSGGSGAAVANGDVDIVLGVDEGGSGRIPAAWCGIASIKATHGLVPAFGLTYSFPNSVVDSPNTS